MPRQKNLQINSLMCDHGSYSIFLSQCPLLSWEGEQLWEIIFTNLALEGFAWLWSLHRVVHREVVHTSSVWPSGRGKLYEVFLNLSKTHTELSRRLWQFFCKWMLPDFHFSPFLHFPHSKSFRLS